MDTWTTGANILNVFDSQLLLQSSQDCRMQERMATEVKQPTKAPIHKELTEDEERELAMLVELARIYYDGP